jgi:hypothetical protein
MDDRFPKDMTIDTLFAEFGLNKREIIVTIINPVRKDPIYKKGRLAGFKAGLFGGGHYHYKNGVPMSYASTRRRWIKKPKVLVAYDIFTFGKSSHSDWVDVDNCTFDVIKM